MSGLLLLMQKLLMKFAIAAALGCVVFVVAGYLVYAAPGGGVNFGYWINNPFRFYVWAWALIGAAVGAGTVTAARK